MQRLIDSLEKQAETYGKSGVDRLITQRDQLLQRYNREPQAIDAITWSYEKMIAAEEKVAREALAVKAAKEAEEALQKQSESIKAFGERVGQFMENPLQGAKGAISSVLTALGPFGIAVASGAAVLGTIAVSAFEAAKSLGEYGTRREIQGRKLKSEFRWPENGGDFGSEMKPRDTSHRRSPPIVTASGWITLARNTSKASRTTLDWTEVARMVNAAMAQANVCAAFMVLTEDVVKIAGQHGGDAVSV